MSQPRRYQVSELVKVEIEQEDGSYKKEQREPECGEDFCDRCGDCLKCYGGQDCYTGDTMDYGSHRWVIYR